MALVPKLSSAGLADINSNSAYEKLKFIEEHYEELMQAYQVIMEHLKIVNEPVELPEDLVTYDADNNVLKSGENTIQISADVPDDLVLYLPESISNEYSDQVPNWNQVTDAPDAAYHTGVTFTYNDTPVHIPQDILYSIYTYGNYREHHLVCSNGSILFEVEELITSKQVGNEASKIPIYTADGHLKLPDGTEIWREE